jgi:hypothetical protein
MESVADPPLVIEVEVAACPGAHAREAVDEAVPLKYVSFTIEGIEVVARPVAVVVAPSPTV